MTDQELTQRFAFAQDLMVRAGALALGYFQNLSALTIKSKGVQDMASEADLQTELLIQTSLKQRFPEDAFFGEETGPTALEGARGVWVEDPIDGTQPFLCGMAAWCISIAFVADGVTELGLVFAPASGELFLARRGHGATLNGTPIRATEATTLREGITSMGYSVRVGPKQLIPAMTRLLEAGGMFHRNGSGAISLCYVAAGRLLGYVEAHINSWDCLAGLLMIEEAGGTVCDFLAGDGLSLGNALVAGGRGVYPALLDVLGDTGLRAAWRDGV